MNLIANFLCREPGCDFTYPYHLSDAEPKNAVVVCDYCFVHVTADNLWHGMEYFDLDGKKIA
jgi:hypothetical protein